MAFTKGRTSEASVTPTVRVGDAAPALALTAHTGEAFDLAEQRGKNVVLAFFPFAFTPT